MKNLINWKLFFILLVVCVITSVMVLPYSIALTSAEISVSPLIIILSTVANNLIIFAIAVFFGLLLSKQIGQPDGGFRLPIIQGILEGKNQTKEFKSLLPLSIGLGIIAGVLIIALSIPFNNAIPEFKNMEAQTADAWRGFLASFYGGIAEEVLLRLFVVSLIVWIGFKIKKNADGSPTVTGIWIAIILSAILFGIGHLPATALIVDLNGMVVLRAIVLNGIGGVIFGWLFWKRGLESAIVAHFSTDIVLHVITPLVLSIFK